MRNIAVFASGRGTNFQAIADAVKKGIVKADISLLVCDNPSATVLKKAKAEKIKVFLIERRDFASKLDFEAAIIKELKKEKIDLIVLAGFMRILSAEFVRAFRNRIINIHPSLLPSFKGEHGIKDAFDYGVKITGVTVHFVDEKMDHGPIILQEHVRINKNDSPASLEAKIHRIEHSIYPQAIKLFVERRLRVLGRKVKV